MPTRRKGQKKGKAAKKVAVKRGGRRRTTWGKDRPPPKSPGRPPLPPDYKAALDTRLGPAAANAQEAILFNPDHPRHEQMVEYTLNRWKGTPTTRTEISGPAGGPVTMTTVTTSGAKRARAIELIKAAQARVSAAKTEPDGAAGAG